MAFLQLCGLLSLAGLTSAVHTLKTKTGQDESERAFADYAERFDRQYIHGSEEYWLRRGLFEQRRAEVMAHNANPERLWQAVAGPFADHTEEERQAVRGYWGNKRHGPSVGGPAHASLLSLNSLVRMERSTAQNPTALEPNILDRMTKVPPSFEEGFHDHMQLPSGKKIWDQGPCGSCWAVTAKQVLDLNKEAAHVGSVGSAASIMMSMDAETVDFSAQQIIDCVDNSLLQCGGQGGCQGATVELAFQYVEQNNVTLLPRLKYHSLLQKCSAIEGQAQCTGDCAVTSNKCMPRCANAASAAPASSLIATIGASGGVSRRVEPHAGGGAAIGMKGWIKLIQNEGLDGSTRTGKAPQFATSLMSMQTGSMAGGEIMRALVNNGPVGISIAAHGMHEYQSGLFTCKPGHDTVVDHAVTLMGYGSEKLSLIQSMLQGESKKRQHDLDESVAYWTIKNSWGKHWGEQGFVRVKHSDMCNRDSDNQKGTGCINDPKEITVCGMCGMFWDSAVPYFERQGVAQPTQSPVQSEAPQPKPEKEKVGQPIKTQGQQDAPQTESEKEKVGQPTQRVRMVSIVLVVLSFFLAFLAFAIRTKRG